MRENFTKKDKQPKKKKSKRRGKPSGNRFISMESAAFIFAMLAMTNDPAASDRAVKLALRGPDMIKEILRNLLEAQGKNVDLFMSQEPATSATKEEVLELAEPTLKKGIEIASIAQLFDTYIFNQDMLPDNVVYALYNGARILTVGEREPTDEESKFIWQSTLSIARISQIGSRHWEKLESQGPFALEDWLDKVKENARKRFQTFLSRKQRIEANADQTFKTLIALFFGDSDKKSS